jgi:membrane glycosyltransferase
MSADSSPSEIPSAHEANFAHVVSAVPEEPEMPLPPEPPPVISPPECAPVLVSRLRVNLRRCCFFGAVVLVNLIAGLWLADLFDRQGFHKSHYFILTVFALLNGLLVLGSFHAFAGVWDWLFSWRSVRITRTSGEDQAPLTHRYAVVMPVYNEDIVKVSARVEAIYRSIEQTGQLAAFDFFLLSDTTQLSLWVEEEGFFIVVVASMRIARRATLATSLKPGVVVMKACWCWMLIA